MGHSRRMIHSDFLEDNLPVYAGEAIANPVHRWTTAEQLAEMTPKI
ncbi:hypothetical protein LEP3755_62710 (plasmid) [Leptolyngbya sp. NIES-3755]|nr:hypothetical protein LEP3755_62710 [Leptolyngbya sp. NIES-3755]